ncbi:MAG: hypothetical protein NTV84_03155, partial [Methanoregula sp.]|nr:hypothetical protein [Methanoregula sp.]
MAGLTAAGTKSHPAGREEVGAEDIARRLIEADAENRFSWDKKELIQHYIPLASEIIARKDKLGARFVVGVSGCGGCGKTEFTKRLKAVLEIILGQGHVGIMLQGGFLGHPDYVEKVSVRLTAEGRKVPDYAAHPLFLDIPALLMQLRSYREYG